MGGPLKRSLDEIVDFSKVKGIDFYISDLPDKNDKPGEGFVVINEIRGERSQPHPGWLEWPITIATAPAAVTGLIGLIGGFLYGRHSRLKS